ncbi:hypothetical protein ANO11243_036440 [Dothideomycetidae sp. 11243]|nr:hypothetical protein ANO11243_036440 [fungal sp. No.11243]
MRIAEIMQDYRVIHTNLVALQSQIQIPRKYANMDGYLILRQCLAEASILLSQPYEATHSHPQGDPEREKTQLRQVLMDAALRRHRAQKLYARAAAARRWIVSRETLLKGQDPQAEHAQALAQISHTLRNMILDHAQGAAFMLLDEGSGEFQK